jgi:hypothetical protein
MNRENELIELLREAQLTLLAQHDPEDNIEMANRIDAALAKPPTTRISEAQEEWVIRLCKALLMWGQKAHGDYTIGIGTDAQESFTPVSLANRVLKECGIPAAFPDAPSKPARRKNP